MKILLAGGGTAGHINPALAIARYALVMDKNTQILFIGKTGGMESKLVPKEGFLIKYIDVEGLRRKITPSNIVTAFKMFSAYEKSIKIIDEFKPDVVVGTGGYVCAPPVFAAQHRKIPTLIHEQNVFPGSAIKVLSKKATVTAISFKDTESYLQSAKKTVLTGNPIRLSLLSTDYDTSREILGIGNKKFIVAFGGSLGASKINDVMIEFIEKINGSNINLCFGTGDREYGRVKSIIKNKGIVLADNIKITPYIHNMDTVLNAADLVIGRSGAITLSELCALGKASVLIPSPNVTNNHQEYNARALADNKAACMILEKDFNINTLTSNVQRILNDDKVRHTMCRNARKMGTLSATDMIYRELVKISSSGK